MQTHCKIIRPMHPAANTVWETKNESTCTHTHTHRKMIWPWRPVVQSARRQTSGRQVKIRRAEGIIDQAEASGTAIISETHQGIQQSNHLEDILKEMNATFGKMIRPSHPAKQPCGRHMTRNACKPLAK